MVTMTPRFKPLLTFAGCAMQCDFELAGVNSFIIRLGSAPSATLVHKIGAIAQLIQQQFSLHIQDVVPSYTTLLVVYDVRTTTFSSLQERLAKAIEASAILTDKVAAASANKTVRLPVCYDPSLGFDLQPLADRLGLSIEAIIRLHSEVVYQVYAIGFSPGFGYLGTLDPQLRVPRLPTPRTAVPAGSVAIAEAYSAVYPQQTPGGWWIVGRCPVSLFEPTREPINLLRVGDNVVFEPIELDAFHAYQEAH